MKSKKLFGVFNIVDIILILAVIAVGIVIMTVVSRLSVKKPLREILWEKPVLGNAIMAVLCIVILVFGCYGLGYDASAFIYGGTFN